MEKSQWKVHLSFMLTYSVYLEKWASVIIILRYHQQPKWINLPLLVTHCLHNGHLIQHKKCLIVIEVKIVWKGFVKTRTINYEKKEMIPLTNEENKAYEKKNVCCICKKQLTNHGYDNNKKYQKVRAIIAITQENLEQVLITCS